MKKVVGLIFVVSLLLMVSFVQAGDLPPPQGTETVFVITGNFQASLPLVPETALFTPLGNSLVLMDVVAPECEGAKKVTQCLVTLTRKNSSQGDRY